jgi:primase-polymerase (primpol)-like protein
MGETLPDVTFFELDNIPTELREQKQWVCWRWGHSADAKL